MRKKLLLIDGYSIICRGYYALPLLTTKKGQHTNACLGFFNIFYKVVEEEKPDYIAVAFDENAPTFRHEIFKDYKGQRAPMPDELKEQVPYVKDILNDMNVKIVSKIGYEADDILGTLSNKFASKNLEAIILSGDRDMLQLATTNIKIRLVKTLNNKSNTFNYYEDDVYNELQVTPTEFIDVKALMGDNSDNIPGLTGIGEKTAFSLIQQYKSIDNIYLHIDEITKKKLHETLVNEHKEALFYKKLVTIVKDAPIEVNIDELLNFDIKNDKAKSAFLKYEMFSIYKRLGGKIKNEKEDSILNLFDEDENVLKNNIEKNNINDINDFLDEINLDNIDNVECNDVDNYILNNQYIDINEKEYNDIINNINDSLKNNKLGFYIEKNENEIFTNLYLLFNNKGYRFGAVDVSKIFADDLINKISKYKNISIYTYNLKKQLYFLDFDDNIYNRFNNDSIEKIEDISLMRYLINPTDKNVFSIDKFINMYNHIDNYIDKLNKLGLYDLYKKTEMPLIFVLYNMEKIGIKVDGVSLNKYGDMLAKKVEELEKDIHNIAEDDKFNIKSPKQLGEILYNKLKIPYPEKNNKMSTSAEILEKIVDKHPIIEKILTYRTYTKLLDTYAVGLRKFILNDSRIHTTFNQIETATGRLTSENPNLQNIPIRSEVGKKLREIFVPRDGYVFIDADYSQIELRILSILSKDKTMINDFVSGVDIHTSTASKIFNVDVDKVDSLMRRKAKVVNFGLIYGISSYGLGEDLHISSKDAKLYMDAYFNTYYDIKKYLDDIVEEAKNRFYTKTYYNRIRPIQEFKTGNPFQKAFAKRVAMNSPIQGTASDIIKKAMVGIDNDIKKEKLDSRLLLQVHDEVLIECKIGEEDKIKKILYKNMRDAFDFEIKLEIEINVGKNWGEAH